MEQTIEPDTKDWTWVLDRPCPECGFVADDVPVTAVAEAVRANAVLWRAVLSTSGAAQRPRPGVWSPTEYGAHVRDVHRVFEGRLRAMLDERDPLFANWDQDATAVEERYDLAEPRGVADELQSSASSVAAVYDAVPAEAWERTGRRSNGSVFTVGTLARYHLHDLVHHVWDVRAALTVAAYDASAADYAGAAGADDLARRAAAVAPFAAALGAGARVLEIGSGGGHDALALEAAGVGVRRTDVTAGFVALLREAGYPADVVDPLTAADVELTDPERPGAPYDGVWANASLLHVLRADLPVVLARLAGVTRADGVLHLSVKEGDGDGWSTHGVVGIPRRFTYWREEPLRAVLAAAGWRVGEVVRRDGLRGESWLEVTASRMDA